MKCAIVRAGLGILLGTAIAEPAARGQEPQAVEASTPALVAARLVHDLGADDYRLRAAADLRLAELGVAIRPELEQALLSENPEIRLRARDLLRRMEIERLWQASRFRYAARGKPASAALVELANQTGNHVLLGDQYGSFDDKPLDYDVTDGEFWPTLDEVCRRTGNKLRPHYDSREPGLVLTAGESGRFPVAYAGPIRAQILSARRAFSEEIDYETVRSDTSHTFQINLQMMWEDRFRLIAYRSQPELVSAKTDAGVEIASTQPQSSGWNVAGGGARQLTMNLRLHPPSTAAVKLAKLELKWGLIAVGDMAELTIDDLTRRDPVYRDDVELRIENVESGPGQRCEVTLGVVRDLVLDDPHEAFFQECDVDLLDQAGVAYRKQGQTNSHDDDCARMKLTFVGESAESQPQRLVFRYPRIRDRRDVVIVFRDVPLPNGRPD